MHCEKDLSIVKKICRSGLNLFLCFALMVFRNFLLPKKKLTLLTVNRPSMPNNDYIVAVLSVLWLMEVFWSVG